MLIPGRVFPFALLIFIVIGILYLTKQLREGRQIELGEIPAFAAIDEAVGRAAELGRPVHYTFGTGPMDASIFASFKILGHVAEKCAHMDVKMIVTLALAEEQPIVEEILKTAWRVADKADAYQPDFVRFLSSGFAYSTGIFAIFAREKPAANLLLGQYFNESLLIATAARRVGAFQIAGTTVESQIPVIVAMCDYSLIGEEMLIAGAYLSQTPVEIASVAVHDVAKIAAIALCCIGPLLTLLGGGDHIIRILGT